MQEETILFNPDERLFCVLNPTAAFVWDQLEQPKSEAELAAGLRDRFAVDAANDVPADVRATLERLEDLHLVVRASDG